MSTSFRTAYLDVLAHAFRNASFDVWQEEQALDLCLTARFAQRSEGYALVKKATLWAAEVYEYVYVYTPSYLDQVSWQALQADALARGSKSVRVHDEHMTSYVSVVVLCTQWQEEAARQVQQANFVKSFWFGLRGWMRLRTIAFCLSREGTGLYTCNKPAQKTLCPLLHEALSALCSLQELKLV